MRFASGYAVGLAVGLVLGGPDAAPAQSGRPPARVVLFDEAIAETPGFVATLGAATLRKGKPKHLLRLDVRLVVVPFSGSSLALVQSIRVNGHSFFGAPPGAPGGEHLCSANTYCVAGGSAWVDLDQAEISFPGDFRGQPLEIEVTGRAESNDPIATFRLQILGELTKK